MGHKLADEELELYRRVDEVLFYVWDPLGVANSPAARDEYYGYLPIVFSMLQGEGANVSTIAAYLDNIASLRMGLDANPEHSNRVAELLLDWKTEVRAILHGRSKPPDQNKSSASMRTSFLKRATSGRSRSPSNLSTQGLVLPAQWPVSGEQIGSGIASRRPEADARQLAKTAPCKAALY